jgi:tol-pal system protein YbgF
MRSRLLSFFLAASFALAAAPSAGALFGDDQARKGVAEQKARVDGLTQRYDELAGRLAKLEDTLKAQTTTGSQSVLDLAGQVQAVRDELRSMRGQLEVLSNNLDAAAKRQRDMYVDLDTRLRRFEQAPPPAGAPPAGPGAAAPGPPPPGAGAASPPFAAAAAQAAAAAPAVDETRSYEAAQNQRRIGNYQGALAAFQKFVLQYPRSPLAHRAQYWIGDSYYNLRDYRNAIANQQKLVATYPESASVPDALLNMASAYIELGDTAAAKKTMDGLVARYPSSEAAEKARRRLTALR